MPWYGWLHIVGLVVLWFFYLFNHKLEQTGTVMRWSNYTMLIRAAYCAATGTSGQLTARSGGMQSAAAVFFWRCCHGNLSVLLWLWRRPRRCRAGYGRDAG